MKFKRLTDHSTVYTANGIRGKWQVQPWLDKVRGDKLALLLFRDGEKPRPFGFFDVRDDAYEAAARFDERGN